MSRAGRTLDEAFAAACLVTRGPLPTNDNGWVVDRDGEAQLDVEVKGDIWLALELAQTAVGLARAEDNPSVLEAAQRARRRFRNLAIEALDTD